MHTARGFLSLPLLVLIALGVVALGGVGWWSTHRQSPTIRPVENSQAIQKITAESPVPQKGLGHCGGYSNYAVAEGVIVRGGESTEIPASLCEQADLFGTKGYAVYRGKTKAYLLDDYGYEGDYGIEALSIAELTSLDPIKIQQIGTSTNPWFFSDGSTVLRVAYIPDGTGSAFDEPVARVMPHADASSLRLLSQDFAIDKTHVYYHDTVLAGADPASFEVITDEPGGFESRAHSVARDKSATWNDGVKTTTEVLGSPHAYQVHIHITNAGPYHISQQQESNPHMAAGDTAEITINNSEQVTMSVASVGVSGSYAAAFTFTTPVETKTVSDRQAVTLSEFSPGVPKLWIDATVQSPVVKGTVEVSFEVHYNTGDE